jgi:hypothetical protein
VSDQSPEQNAPENAGHDDVSSAPRPSAASDVSWLKYKRLARFLARLQRKTTCVFEVVPDGTVPNTCRIAADNVSARQLNRQLGRLSFRKFRNGLLTGIVLGIVAAYVLIPTGATYWYSSRRGLLPPEYDALLRTKNINDQVMQILEHEFKARTKGLFGGKRVLFEARIDDTTSITLACDAQRKGVVKSVGQRVGTRKVGSMVGSQVSRTGLDSSVSEGLGEAVSRTVDMTVEKSFRSNPVLHVVTRVDGRETEFVNFCGEKHRSDFTARDSDSTDTRDYDHTKVRRKHRVPTPDDERLYRALVQGFVGAYLSGEIIGTR